MPEFFVKEHLITGGILDALLQLRTPGDYIVELKDEHVIVSSTESHSAELIKELFEKYEEAGEPLTPMDALNIIRGAEFWLTYLIKAASGSEAIETVKQQLQEQLDGKKGNGVN